MSNALTVDSESSNFRRTPFRLLFMIVLADMLGFGIVIPLLPFYARKFHAGDLQVTLLLSIYSLCQFVAAPILGSLSDRIGRRPVLIFSQLGSMSASITLGIATAWHFQNPALGLLIVYVSRVLDGFSGGNVSAAQAYISDVVAPENRAKYMGLLGAAFGIGFAIGPGIGGLLGHFNEALPPFVAATFSLTAATLAYFKLPESLKHPIHHQAGRHFTRSARLMREPILAQIVLVWFISMFAFVMMESIFAIFLEDRFGFGALGVGMMFMLAGIIIIAVQGGLIGKLTNLIGEWNIAIVGPALFGIGMLIFTQSSITPLIGLLICGILFNATGRSLQTPTISTLVSRVAPAGGQGAAFGLFHGMGSLSRVFGPALAGWLYSPARTWLPFLIAACLTFSAGAWMLLIRWQSARRLDPASLAMNVTSAAQKSL